MNIIMTEHETGNFKLVLIGKPEEIKQVLKALHDKGLLSKEDWEDFLK